MSDELLSRFPEEDQEFLQRKNAKLVAGPGLIYVVLENENLGAAYTPITSSVMFQVPFGYPDAAMDMFWTNPHIRLASSAAEPQAAAVYEPHMGEQWQRWSRHITWRAGLDNLRTFYRAFRTELALER